MTLPQGPNQRWSLDFASDTLTDGSARARPVHLTATYRQSAQGTRG
jgi:hypothetical protein